MISLIAKSIESADKSYFFEDYASQANAVIQELSKNGFCIVPLEPDSRLIDVGIKAISYGRSKPSDIVKRVYIDMISATRSK